MIGALAFLTIVGTNFGSGGNNLLNLSLTGVTSSSSCVPSVAALTAARDPSRPIRRGMATWGNNTTSRSGRTGSRRLPVLEVRFVLRLPSSAA